MSTTRSQSMQSGQGLVEYALILILVAIVVIGSLTVIGPQVGNLFCTIVNSAQGSSTTACSSISNSNTIQTIDCSGNNGNGNGRGNCNNGKGNNDNSNNGNNSNGNGNGNGG